MPLRRVPRTRTTPVTSTATTPITDAAIRMETLFHISKCAVENQVKFATYTLHGIALTWWKSHVKTVGQDAAHSMPWNTLMKMITAKMFPEESDKIEKYVGSHPDMIHRSVMASKLKTMQDAVDFATVLMDKKIRTFAERQVENKRKFEETSRNNQNQQQQNKRQNTDMAYNAGSEIPTNDNTANNQRGTRAGQKATCFECGAQGHFKREYPKLKNNNRGNQGENGNAPTKLYVVGNVSTNLDSNIVTGTFLLNNRYAYILFDTCANRSFVSTAFSSEIDITSTTLDHYYDVELADEKIIGINTIIRGCTLNFLNHPFNIYLMPIELGSFDVIIGNETLIVHGNGSDQGNETRLNIISRTKTQKYKLKGCHVFVAYVTTKNTDVTKKTEYKSEGKRLEDVPIIRDFPKVFLKDLLGLPPTQKVEFQIDLIPGAASVARAPYRLAPSEIKEFSDQL
ncbi:putative reverse transcriptase domain-containing protein [Tanacetum coccineum]